MIAQQRVKLELTDRPAPFLAGLYSVQAIPGEPESGPDVTVYRATANAAATWVKSAAISSRYGKFLLRHGDDAWDVYDDKGDLTALCSDVTGRNHVKENQDAVDVDYDAFQGEGCAALRNMQASKLVAAASHAGASSADHDNLAILSRRMIVAAGAEDLAHMHIIDSRRWPCRVTGLFADVSQLSEAMRDVYLDRYKWIARGWPISTSTYVDTLADRLTRTRPDYVRSVIERSCRALRYPDARVYGIVARWVLASPGNRYDIARSLVGVLQPGVLYDGRLAEKFDEAYVEKHAGKAVRQTFKPRKRGRRRPAAKEGIQ